MKDKETGTVVGLRRLRGNKAHMYPGTLPQILDRTLGNSKKAVRLMALHRCYIPVLHRCYIPVLTVVRRLAKMFALGVYGNCTIFTFP